MPRKEVLVDDLPSIDDLKAMRVVEARLKELPDEHALKQILYGQGKPVGRFTNSMPYKDELIARIHAPAVVKKRVIVDMDPQEERLHKKYKKNEIRDKLYAWQHFKTDMGKRWTLPADHFALTANLRDDKGTKLVHIQNYIKAMAYDKAELAAKEAAEAAAPALAAAGRAELAAARKQLVAQ
jgi:predicted ATP-dependent endonuclease of OLD family